MVATYFNASTIEMGPSIGPYELVGTPLLL